MLMASTLVGVPYGPRPANTVHTIPVAPGPSHQIVILDVATNIPVIPESIDYSVNGQITVTFFVPVAIYGRVY